MLRPTRGDPWGVEQHHWNTGAKENQQLNPGGPSNRQKSSLADALKVYGLPSGQPGPGPPEYAPRLPVTREGLRIRLEGSPITFIVSTAWITIAQAVPTMQYPLIFLVLKSFLDFAITFLPYGPYYKTLLVLFHLI